MTEATENDPPVLQRRRRHYLDRSLQGWLLIGLILLEVLLFSAMLVLLYGELTNAVEAQLYSAHMDPSASRTTLLGITLKLLGVAVAVNLGAVFLADRLWQRRIGRITAELQQVLERVGALDFRGPCRPSVDHAVLRAACHWYETEAERNRRIRAALAELQDEVREKKPLAGIGERLRDLRRIL